MANSPGMTQPFRGHPIELGSPYPGRTELWLSANQKSSPPGENTSHGRSIPRKGLERLLQSLIKPI